MTQQEIKKAITDKEKVVLVFNDNLPNLVGIILRQSKATSVCSVQITQPARAYKSGDIIHVKPYELLPYTWARALPSE